MTNATTYSDARSAARAAAAKVLDQAWNPSSLPVDPIKIARDLGAQVFDAQLGDDTWGMIIGSESGADIYLDRDQPHVRYRFSCAHELGHFVDRSTSLDPGMGYVDKRSNENAGSLDEVYANEFAASILMPEGHFRGMLERGADVFEVCQTFGVSLQAARLRAMHLGLSFR